MVHVESEGVRILPVGLEIVEGEVEQRGDGVAEADLDVVAVEHLLNVGRYFVVLDGGGGEGRIIALRRDVVVELDLLAHGVGHVRALVDFLEGFQLGGVLHLDVEGVHLGAEAAGGQYQKCGCDIFFHCCDVLQG